MRHHTASLTTAAIRPLLSALVLVALAVAPACAQVKVRLLAGNLTSEQAQSYAGHGIRIFQGLKPDIAMVQEYRFGRNTPEDLRRFVDTAFGKEFNAFGSPSMDDGALPNAVVSRYPIKGGGNWHDPEIGNRDFTWARIDVPGPRDLVAISVHLKAGGESGRRDNEARALVEHIRKNVSSDAYIAIGGDFNTKGRDEPCVKTLSAVVKVAAPFPVDQSGDGSTNSNRNKPYDWVLVDPALDALETGVVLPGLPAFNDGLVFDSRRFQPLSAVAPVESGDSQAEGMQHMAVVRDFLFPSGK